MKISVSTYPDANICLVFAIITYFRRHGLGGTEAGGSEAVGQSLFGLVPVRKIVHLQQTLALLHVQQIVFILCNPATCFRDV